MMVTVTTLTTGQKGIHPDPPVDKPFPFPYTEDFEGKFISTNDKNKIHPDWPSTCAVLGKNRKFWKYKVVYVYPKLYVIFLYCFTKLAWP